MGVFRSFLLNYFTNLFIIWEIVLLIIDGLKSFQSVDYFRTLLWENQGYLVILAPITLTEIYYDVMMIKNNKEFFLKIKDNKFQKYLLFATLGMLIVTDYVLFKVGIINIIADQHPVVITNVDSYHFWTTLASIIIYSVIPIVHYAILWLWKKSSKTTNDFNHNRFKIDLTSGIFSICMIFCLILVIVVILNYSTGMLK